MPRRRALIFGAAGATGLAGLAGAAWSVAPGFWRQYGAEWRRPIRPPSHKPTPRHWPDRGLFAAWLGHSTVLLKIDGFTILTDPVFSDRCGIHLGLITLGLKRLTAPALVASELPPIDLVLVSHAHMDHLDIPSLRDLESPHCVVVMASRTSDLIRARRYRAVHEIGWGQSVRVGPAAITGLPVNHWGARLRTDTWRGYNGYLIEAGRYRVIFAGDTALTDHFRHVPGPKRTDLTIMPIGAYNPWIRAHCSPEQAWQMANHTRAEFLLPVHHQTFSLSREPFEEPLERLLTAAGPQASRVSVRHIGAEFGLA